jgi:hypothetical protein
MTINGHFWIENEAGKVIYDPVFPVYKKICRAHRLDIKKPRYRKASPDLQRECLKKHIFPTLQDIMKLAKECGGMMPPSVRRPEAYACALNCIVYKVSGGEGRITYGDFGWEKQDGSRIWYEFEHDMSDAEHDMRDVLDVMKNNPVVFGTRFNEVLKEWKKLGKI